MDEYRPISFEADYPLAVWEEANLNNEAIAMGYPATGPNRLLDPAECNRFVAEVARRKKCQFTFGGNAEDRSFLWRGHYHNPFRMQHLGTDYNLPAGSRIAAPAAFKVIHSWRDPDQNGGWGGRIVGELERGYRGATHVIIGHLAHNSLPQVGEYFERGRIFGLVGEVRENGGWYEHTHVQLIGRRVARHTALWEAIDGYDTNGVDISEDYPDARGWMSGLPE